MRKIQQISRKSFHRGLLGLVMVLAFSSSLAQVPHSARPAFAIVNNGSSSQNIKEIPQADYFVEMPPFDEDSARTIDDLAGNRVGGLRFANTFFTDLRPGNSGICYHTDDGTLVWKVGIRSSGAYSLNVLFSEFTLPKGASVYLYNPDQSCVLGGFTRENRPEGGELSVAPVDGDELIVEYHEPPDAEFPGNLRITEVNHDYRGLFRRGTAFGLDYLPCIPGTSCLPSLDTISRSVCLLIINGVSLCTGTFLNNTARDGKPYLLTASHCLQNNATYGSRVVAFLNYQSPRCNSIIRGSEEFSISGSVTRAISSDIDFALLEFQELPPADYRPYLAGWSLQTDTVGDAPFFSIHHPNADVKRYCEERDTISRADWESDLIETSPIQKGNHWSVPHWEVGHTWGGSSGGPLFDRLNRVIGGLTGGQSGGFLGCDSLKYEDYFYRLNRAWRTHSLFNQQLMHWLDPLAPDSLSGTSQLEGMDPYESAPAKRISNLLPTDSMALIRLPEPESGPLFGHNSLHSNFFAEHYTVSDTSMVYGVYLVTAKGKNLVTKPVTVQVYEGGEKPGKLLGRAVLNPHYDDYYSGDFVQKKKESFVNRENYLRFDSAIYCGKDFYIGYTISYPSRVPSDTFCVYAALRPFGSVNTTFFKSDAHWMPYTEHPFLPLSTSLWIEPVIGKNTIRNPQAFSVSRPTLAWSQSEHLLYLSFPLQWTGKTKVDVIDISGRRMMSATVMPPLDVISIPDPSPRIYLIRMDNGKMVNIQKVRIGLGE